MKLRNAAPQWKHSWHSSYSRYWEIDDKRDNSRKAFRNAFRITIWLWVLKRVSKEENTAKVRSDTRLSQKHVSVEMINAKLFWNAFTMCPRKTPTEPAWNNGQKLWDVLLLSYLFHEVWLRYAFEWYIIEIHPIMLHWAALFSKLNVKSHFVPLSGTWTCMQGNCYNRSPMWPSLGFKPFSTQKQHGFIYMMILDNHLNNSLSFSSCVPSHHHWHKSTVALLNIVWFCARCSQKC